MARKFNVGEEAVLKGTNRNWNVRIVDTFEDEGTWYYEVECLDVSDNIRTKCHREVPQTALSRHSA